MMDTRLDKTIAALSTELRPVRPLGSPLLHAGLWLLGGLALGGVLYAILGRGLGDVVARPWVLAAVIGAVLTAIAAAAAAFAISRPDRSDRWALLVAPPALLWILSTVIGCIEGQGDPETWGSTSQEVLTCLTVILGAATPLSVLAIVMVRRARPERWLKVALLGGLASAAAAGSILLVVNPHNSTVLDVAIHTACIAAVVSITAIVGGRTLHRASATGR